MVRKLVVNGETVVLSDEVLNKLRHQEYIEKGKLIVKTLGLNDVYNKMTDDNFEEIVLYFEEMLNADTNELMAEAVQNVSEQVEKRYRYKTKIDVQKKLLKQRRTDNY